MEFIQEKIKEKAKAKAEEILIEFLKSMAKNRFAMLLREKTKVSDTPIYVAINGILNRCEYDGLNYKEAYEQLIENIINEETEKLLSKENGFFD